MENYRPIKVSAYQGTPLVINGIVLLADKSGRVFFCSHWEKISQLRLAGYLTSKTYSNCFGHTKFKFA